MSMIFIPANKPQDWRLLLAQRKHWRRGYSARALAYCWQEVEGFPESVKRIFKGSGIKLFRNVELLLAFPEWKVPLLGGSRPSQNDIFILAKGNNQLISIMVEGKVSEPFDKTVTEWKLENSGGKETRLNFLCGELQLEKQQIDHIRYQLLHRTASAVIEAKRFKAENALMLVHSFSQSNEWFEDFSQFLALFGLNNVKPDSSVFAKNINGINLYFSWVRGDKKYLSKWWTGDLS